MLRKLKILLFERKISQRSLADATGIHPSRISRLLRGRFQPRAAERAAISRVLGVPESLLFPQARRARRRTRALRKL